MLKKPEALCAGCPLYEGPYGKKLGFSVPHGIGSSGLMFVAESLGKDEEAAGIPLVGPSGQYLFSQLQRVGINRDQFFLHNVVACRPPDNKLVKMPYESECIKKCSPYLDEVIEDCRKKATAFGKTFVIVALGKTAFKRLTG